MPKKTFTVTMNIKWCKGCEICVAVCPKKVFSKSRKISSAGYFCPEIKDELCSGCRQCELLCPDQALKVDERK